MSEKISGPGAASLFSKVPALATVNPAISDAAHRLLTFMALPGVGDGTAVLSAPEISVSLGWCERKVKYCIAALLRLGIVDVTRRTGEANAYRIKSEVFAEIPRESRTERLMKEKPKLAPCECGRLGVLKFGKCLNCRKDHRQAQKIRQIVKEEIRRAG